jgi:hypothetical protein
MPGYVVTEPRAVVVEPRAAIVEPRAVVVARPPEYVVEAPAYESTLTARTLRYSDPYVDVGYGRSCRIGFDGIERCY